MAEVRSIDLPGDVGIVIRFKGEKDLVSFTIQKPLLLQWKVDFRSRREEQPV